MKSSEIFQKKFLQHSCDLQISFGEFSEIFRKEISKKRCHSGESACLPPVWPRVIYIQKLCLLLVLALLWGFSLVFSGFSSSLNIQDCQSTIPDYMSLLHNMQGCALAAPGRLRRLTFGLRRLKKKKRSPVRALRFRLVWKPETKRANVLKRNETKKTSSCSRAPVSPKNKSADSAVQFNILCDLY